MIGAGSAFPGAPASTAACCAVMVECHVTGMVALPSTDSHNAPWARVRQPCGGLATGWDGRTGGPRCRAVAGFKAAFAPRALLAGGKARDSKVFLVGPIYFASLFPK
jgi:hypothetical protein